jgi:putative transposase
MFRIQHWEGRHKGSRVQADQYLLTCMRYIELNPVAAGMVQSPGQYRWSCYRRHAWGEPNPLLRGHDLYVRLGKGVVVISFGASTC